MDAALKSKNDMRLSISEKKKTGKNVAHLLTATYNLNTWDKVRAQ